MEAKHKFEIGQKVIYDGLIGIIESRSTYVDDTFCYGLIAQEDNEMSCTAPERECELYIDQEIDQREALLQAKASSIAIQGTVGNITDKYFRDGSH